MAEGSGHRARLLIRTSRNLITPVGAQPSGRIYINRPRERAPTKNIYAGRQQELRLIKGLGIRA